MAEKTRFGVPIDTTRTVDPVTNEVYSSISEMAKAHIKHIAATHRVDEATVRDVISGKKTNLRTRRQELEQAGNE